MEQTVYLTLQDGLCLPGKPFGAPLRRDVTAEVVFTTAMTGYVETLTDPSYYGQMVVQTFPLIGNYGVCPSDFESGAVHMSAYLVREWCPAPSNFRSRMDLDSFLKQQNIPGVYGLDTRFLTRRIRERGVMNGLLSREKPDDSQVTALSRWSIENAVEKVTIDKAESFPAPLPLYHVVLMDFGAKRNIIRRLHAHNVSVTAVPANASCEDILALSPDGVMLSNGPGNPAENPSVVAELAKLMGSGVPVFGICLGHQLLALAAGAKTEKLKYGHRGANQPVKDLSDGHTYITSQNHGYAVTCESLPADAALRFINLNDGTCEGIRYRDFPGLSVQFHPEACGGPRDTEFLFDEFLEMMKGRRRPCPSTQS